MEYPNHPQQRFRLPCNCTLFVKVQKKGEVNLILSKCNQWFQNGDLRETLVDITDGRIWKKLISDMSLDHEPMNILGVLINIDFFQPFKHVSYSVGVIYAVIINLPRHTRYKPNNVIIIGVIPGPHEPKKHLNSYLGPVVTELQELNIGHWFDTAIGRQFIRCVLVGLSSDIPASRKAAGYLGHMAKRACSRCLKEFVKVGDNTNYSGYERETWPLRIHSIQYDQAHQTFRANTKEARKNLEKTFGLRYSILHEIPYYDSVRFSAIDAMHNLFSWLQ